MTHRGICTTTASLALLWLGLLLGVSFLATPVKFMAPSLSLPVALDVGRQTFMVFNWVEIVLAVVLLGLVFIRMELWLSALALVAALIVAVQALWLLPVLDARVEMIIQGGSPSPSLLHNLYIALDSIKLLILGLITALAYRVGNRARPE